MRPGTSSPIVRKPSACERTPPTIETAQITEKASSTQPPTRIARIPFLLDVARDATNYDPIACIASASAATAVTPWKE